MWNLKFEKKIGPKWLNFLRKKMIFLNFAKNVTFFNKIWPNFWRRSRTTSHRDRNQLKKKKKSKPPSSGSNSWPTDFFKIWPKMAQFLINQQKNLRHEKVLLGICSKSVKQIRVLVCSGRCWQFLFYRLQNGAKDAIFMRID